jgi:hypothetical protein
MNETIIFIASILFLEIIFITAILFVLSQALKKTGRGLKTVFVVAIILFLWLTGITIFNFTMEVFTNELLLGVVIPVILGILLLLWKPYKEVIKAIPQAHYMKLQALRILFGVLFLLEAFFNSLPTWFRNLAGFGDIAAGIAGSFAFILIARFGVKQWQVITANSVGILDFLTVLPLGLIVVVVDAPVELTINLIPLFAVPLFILQHIYSLIYLKAQQSG